jgi:predicted signal transduction protein with EAL and GGDEF domain
VLREDDLVVRWGGEEFLVVLRSAAADGVPALAQRMLDAVGGEPVVVGDGRVPVTVSIGYAGFPLPPSNLALPWERAIDLVDTAMYLAKAHGRNRAYGVKAMHARDAEHAQAIGRALEDAWHAGEVELVRLDGPAAVAPGAAPRLGVAA